MGRLPVVVSVSLYVVTITRHSVDQTQCCHVGRLFVVVSVSLYIVSAITRHSVAMWGVVVSVSVVTITRHSVAMWGYNIQ